MEEWTDKGVCPDRTDEGGTSCKKGVEETGDEWNQRNRGHRRRRGFPDRVFPKGPNVPWKGERIRPRTGVGLVVEGRGARYSLDSKGLERARGGVMGVRQSSTRGREGSEEG